MSKYLVNCYWKFENINRLLIAYRFLATRPPFVLRCPKLYMLNDTNLFEIFLGEFCVNKIENMQLNRT